MQHRKASVGPVRPRTRRARPPLALDTQERQVLLETLNSERFVDTAPAAGHATLLDEGSYLGSVRTMYRLLAADGGSRERRDQLVQLAAAAAVHRLQPEDLRSFRPVGPEPKT